MIKNKTQVFPDFHQRVGFFYNKGGNKKMEKLSENQIKLLIQGKPEI